VRVAVPGTLTTAYLALKLFAPDIETVVVPFDQIIPQVLEGKYQAGLIIHEGQLTYSKAGLFRVVDLGKWWQDSQGLPLPLGGNVIRRALGPALTASVARSGTVSSTRSIIARKRWNTHCSLRAIWNRSMPTSLWACTLTSARWITGNRAGRPYAACSIWDTRPA
jgi:predicted solute-binding protein